MNPDAALLEAVSTARDRDKKQLEAKRAQSRAAQPKRKDTRRIR